MEAHLQYSLEQLPAVASQLLAAYPNHSVFALEGDLGTGKTSLVQALCTQLGVTDAVDSPTFGLLNEYQGTEGPIYHFDLYRLQSADEAWAIGLQDYLDSGAYCFVEWPGVLGSALKAFGPVYIQLAHLPPTQGSPPSRTLHHFT